MMKLISGYKPYLLPLLAGAFFSASCASESQMPGGMLQSPDKAVSLNFFLSEQQAPVFEVRHQDSLVLESSKLGIVREDADFTRDLRLEEVSAVKPVAETYEMVQGKRRERTYKANEKTFRLRNKQDESIDITFRVSNDGLAFRYSFPGESTEKKEITAEATSFNFPEGSRAWLQPMALVNTGWSGTNPSYEEYYLKDIAVGTPSPTEAGWVFPALFRSGNSWVLLTETAPYGNYVGSHLQQHSPEGEYTLAFPQEGEAFPGGALHPEAALPWSTPWRILTIGSLQTIAESTLGTDLAAPAIEMDPSFLRPGKASWSWVLLKDDSTVFEVQKQFIDYAADMNWQYTLVDADWDQKIGYDKISELAEYANSKGVGLLLWYNSSGSWNTTEYTPKSKLLTREDRAKEFSRIQEMGIKGVKIDFFGGDGQSMMQYYTDILEDAAAHKLLVNFHGSTIPRGWHRTYPNLMTMESIKGMEFITFEQQNANEEAAHSTVIPFARNAFDPMDFTPLVLYKIPGIERKTSNGFQLALPVIFLSGIQHFAETPTGMAQVPEPVKQYLREVPVAWDDSRFVAGYPGELAVIARKDGERWYVAGINGENKEKRVSLDLSFLEKQQGQLFTDGAEEFSFHTAPVRLPQEGMYEITLQANGGFVMVF